MNGKMQPFLRAQAVRSSLSQFIDDCAKYGVPPDEAVRTFDHMGTLEVWKNDQYQVAIDKNVQHGFTKMTLWHLSIKRIDRAPLHDWRDLQRIKELLCGSDVEAIELYPSAARVVDTSNQYHLFALMSLEGEVGPPMIPVGWTSGFTMEPDNDDGSYKDSAARQRPREKRR